MMAMERQYSPYPQYYPPRQQPVMGTAQRTYFHAVNAGTTMPPSYTEEQLSYASSPPMTSSYTTCNSQTPTHYGYPQDTSREYSPSRCQYVPPKQEYNMSPERGLYSASPTRREYNVRPPCEYNLPRQEYTYHTSTPRKRRHMPTTVNLEYNVPTSDCDQTSNSSGARKRCEFTPPGRCEYAPPKSEYTPPPRSAMMPPAYSAPTLSQAPPVSSAQQQQTSVSLGQHIAPVSSSDQQHSTLLTSLGPQQTSVYSCHQKPVTVGNLQTPVSGSSPRRHPPKTCNMCNEDNIKCASSVTSDSSVSSTGSKSLKQRFQTWKRSRRKSKNKDSPARHSVAEISYDSLRKIDRSEAPIEEDLKNAPWYQAGIPREIALEMLTQEEIGCFVVRDSTTHPGCYALSVKVPKFDNPLGISHYLIMRTSHGGVKLKGLDKEWSSLTALVTHHSVMRELLPCALRLPRAANNPAFSDDDDKGEQEEDEDYQRLADCSHMMQDLKM